MFVVEKYKNKWAVLDTVSCVWYFIGRGKKYCEKMAKDLNEMIASWKMQND